MLTNPHGAIANSELELATLVLHESTILEAVPKACMAVPRSGSDNKPTVPWSTRKALMIDLVVADLLRIRALHSIFFLTSSIFTTRAKKNACQMMLPACFIYLTPHFSPICLSYTPSCTVCGKSPSCHRNCFPAWYQRCIGSRESQNNLGYEIAEAIPAVGRILCHPFGQSYSPRSIHPPH